MKTKKLLITLGIGLVVLLLVAGGVRAASAGGKSQVAKTTSAIRLVSAPEGAFSLQASGEVTATKDANEPQLIGGILVGRSVQNDESPNLKDILPVPNKPREMDNEENENPSIPTSHKDEPDSVVQKTLGPFAMPASVLNFDGIPFPGVGCSCAPPDTDGEVGATQYVQMVNEGVQVFNKTTGASVLGPISIATIWSGFGGACETTGSGDPVVLYDQLANRWLISQFASSGGVMTEQCVAVSTTSDATGSYYRYDFHLGANFYDYPKMSVWPDAYYLAENVFNAAGTVYLGPQPFAFDRTAMLTGAAATFVSPGLQSTALGFMLSGDLDGSNLPPAGAPNPWLSAAGATWPLYRFHVDFAIPANTTWTLGGTLTPAGYTGLCTATRNCVPQLGSADGLDGIGDRPMFRLAYRRFGDGHEALVGNRTVSSSAVAGIRWWEINNATSGTPSFVQQSTYQPDTTWRWMGSIAMDTQGNIALGFSASSSTINPQIRYAGRLATDPLNTLAQGEATLFAGTGSQTGTGNRWGDYSDMTVDPVDDCTFWYTQEYYATTGSFNWRTRIGNFKFPGCSIAPDFTVTATPPTQNVCAPANGTINVAVGSLSGYVDPVTLSATGNPAGTTTGFSVNPVTPPGTSVLTIGSTGAGAAGSYTINVSGTSTSGTHAANVGLNLFTAAPAGPALTTPANGAKAVSPLPTFIWSAVPQATTYSIQIATDAAFTSIVASASGLAGTSFTPGAALTGNVLYYWRVWADNTCGTGAYSATFAFVTANLTSASFCSTPNVAIPDANVTGVSNDQVVASAGTIVDLNVSVQATHTWVGDLKFTLQNVGTATSAAIIDQPGVPATTFGCSGDNINVTVNDQGLATPVENQCSNLPAISGDAPGGDPPNTSLLAAFNGQALANTWRMTAVDNAAGDIGTLNQWCLIATYGAANGPVAYADPVDATCGGNSPCFSGGSAIQDGMNFVSSGGQVNVLGSHTVASSLTCVGDVTVAGTAGSSLTWGGGAGNLFTAFNCNLTVKGLAINGGSTANVFSQVGTGSVTAYANNFSNFASAYTGAGSPLLGHSYWGTKVFSAPAPTGMPAGEWLKRLGAPVASWADGGGGTALGSATLGGGNGTAVIVSFGRGAANAPFDNGVLGHVDAMCSEFYDYFTVNGSGTWTLNLPVDAGPAGCVTNTLNLNKLFKITNVTQCAPTDTACWDSVAGTTHAGSNLVVTGLTVGDLDGTHFVAGDSGGFDPTAVGLNDFEAQSSEPIFPLLLAAVVGLLVIAFGGLFIIRQRNRM